MSIQIALVTEDEVVVELPGSSARGGNATLARIVEFGMGPGGIGTYGPYDVRKHLLTSQREGSSRIRPSKTGGSPYRIVNFDQSASALQESASGKDVMDIFKAANERGERVFSADVGRQRTAWGATIPAHIGQRLKPHHAATGVAGGYLFGAEKGASGKSETSRFSTFRTASLSNTNPMAWQSKGVKPRRFGREVQKDVREKILAVL